jgi:hypothetical protein
MAASVPMFIPPEHPVRIELLQSLFRAFYSYPVTLPKGNALVRNVILINRLCKVVPITEPHYLACIPYIQLFFFHYISLPNSDIKCQNFFFAFYYY